MGAAFIRIVSDLHYGDKFSRVGNLEQLRPLLDGPRSLIFNGDSVDTRPSPDPEARAGNIRSVLGFVASAGLPVTLLTGNHDPDITQEHSRELASGQVLVTHGDILYDNIVPWARGADMMRKKIIAALAALPNGDASTFEGRLAAFRTVSASIPQTHQAERNPFLYTLGLASNTVWPPHRAFMILRAWKQLPDRAASLAARHRPRAKVILVGHTHKPGVWRADNGVTVINTGSFCRPFGGLAADVTADSVTVRRVDLRRGHFVPGDKITEIPLT